MSRELTSATKNLSFTPPQEPAMSAVNKENEMPFAIQKKPLAVEPAAEADAENAALKTRVAELEAMLAKPEPIKLGRTWSATRGDFDEIDYDADEPILQENPNRFVILPIQHEAVWKMVCRRAPVRA